MIELRWKKVKKDSPGSMVMITPEDMYASVVLQYRENIKHKETDSHVTYWAWTNWIDVEIADDL